jgi:acyl carrier protein
MKVTGMEEKLKEAIAAELQVEVSTLTPALVLESMETWDSVNRLTIMVLISDAVGVPVEPGEFRSAKTFGDLEALVRSKVK